MNKREFLDRLAIKLCGLPEKDLEERIAFYSETIDDRIESGLSEEEAVADLGSIDEIVASILADTPLTKLVKERMKPKRSMTWWEITLIAVGSPIWIVLFVSLFAVVISVYAVLWSLIAALWAIFVSFAVCTPAGIALSVLCFCDGAIALGIATIGISLFLAGAALLLFFASKAATVGTAMLTKNIALWIKRLFIRKKKEEKK